MLNVEIALKRKNWTKVSTFGDEVFLCMPLNDNRVAETVQREVGKRREALKGFIRSEGSFFSIVARYEETILLACDRIRSIPLYYRLEGQKIQVSDRFDALCNEDNVELDPDSVHELLLSGFVVGDKTVDKEIRQVRAGEYVEISLISGEVIKRSRYYRLKYRDELSIDSGYDDLDRVVREICIDLVQKANGRKIVIPLSGGYDSRLIAINLFELDYKNIVSYSYGVKGNAESQVSRGVAKSLGWDWHFVEHRSEDMARMWSSPDRIAYEKLAFGGVSLPHYQDLFAISELMRLGITSTESIVVPGHAADFNSGGHLPKCVFQDKYISGDTILRHLEEKHFSLVGKRSGLLTERALGSVSRDAVYEAYAAAEIIDDYNMAERQAKFIVNSLRVYEFVGAEWWIPFWDRRFVDFWCRVPLTLKRERWWYNEYVERRAAKYGMPPVLKGSSRLRTALRKTARVAPIELVTRSFRLRSSYNRHPLNPYFFFEKGFVDDCAARGAMVNGVFLLDLIRRLKLDTES